MFGKSILLLIPHPDDEVVGCYAAIKNAKEKGGKVYGYYLTTGIPPREQLWMWQRRSYNERLARRKKEALLVKDLLGIEPVCFQEIPSRTLKEYMEPTRDALIRAIHLLKLDVLWTPTYEGGHQDHDTTNFLASTLTRYARVWEFSEYNYFQGKIKSQEFFRKRGNEKLIIMNKVEQDLKRKALSLYRSERGNLGYINTAQEMFRPLARHDYSKPPHRGKLFYQRFQWVPGHPRIDYCTPEELCYAFRRFLKNQKEGKRFSAEVISSGNSTKV